MSDHATSAEPSCPKCGETPMFRSVVHACCERLEAALTLAERPWDRDDPDTQAAASARGYNCALADMKAVLLGRADAT
jgi:hypothetical protein